MEKYVVGTIIRPHGVRGAIKIDPLTDDISRFKKLKKVYIKDQEYQILNAQISNREVYLTLNNLNDRNEAESLRGEKLYIDKEDAIKPKKGRYFIVDILSSDVFVLDEYIGKLKDVLQYGSADIYVIELLNKKQAMVPALKKLIVDIDIENKKIILDKKVFQEVVVYED